MLRLVVCACVLTVPCYGAGGSRHQACGAIKSAYKANTCCGKPEKLAHHQVVPNPPRVDSANVCKDKKPGWANKECFQDSVVDALEQAGADVTEGYAGSMDVGDRTPITDPYHKTALCPVNVHWHLGAEHRSQGQYDEAGKAPADSKAGTPADVNPNANRRLATGETDDTAKEAVRYGYACHHYSAEDTKFNTEYPWMHCENMHVGETYEVHWPHSALGACATPYQYQSPFYDGVFCGYDPVAMKDLTPQQIAHAVGVQAQVFTIVNDENYYFPDLIRGMIHTDTMGVDIAKYTGSTTGTSRNNKVCSAFSPITWQVDRKCHLISASTFDKMCADMKQMRDDMSMDLHPHGARELVLSQLAANNQVGSEP